MTKPENSSTSPSPLLGEFTIDIEIFKNVDKIINEFSINGFSSLTDRQKFERVNKTLLNFIQNAPRSSFLLPAVIDYITKINKKGLLLNYNFTGFELWLNQYAFLSEAQNYRIRAKIAGKDIPREEYQAFFPIGMGKIHKGVHFITAHSSPDLDTTIASFWGWVDAFAARVSDSLHIWNVPPGGAPLTENVISLYDFFGRHIFEVLPQSRTSLSLSSIHFVTQSSLIKKYPHEYTTGIDHQRYQKAVVIIDEQGFFLGDWRNSDIEGVRQIQQSLNNCLRWFENQLHSNLITLFAKEDLTLSDLPPFLSSIFDLKIKRCEPAKDFSPEQYQHINDYLIKVLDIPKGLDATFNEFANAMEFMSLPEFKRFKSIILESLHDGGLFDHSGSIIENRPRIFYRLKEIIHSLHDAIQKMRNYVETIEVALKIKQRVLQFPMQYVTLQADLQEIKDKMGAHQHLTVITPDQKGNLWPVGVIHAKDIQSSTLGTVSLRDFCNRDEVKIASYLEVISVIDHHRSSLYTQSAPQALIGDAQSCNVLIAEKAFQINDKYSLDGMSKEDIENQILEYESKKENSLKNIKIMQRLYLKKIALDRLSDIHFIHPNRAIAEYVQFLYAILEDTDLLSKVSDRDVFCVTNLLNRLKSLILRKEVEIINIDDIPRDQNFAKKAAKKILKNKDLYSLYGKIYEIKEKQVEKALSLCAQGKKSDFFSDTKEQNGCCRVGQTKVFANNINSLNEVKNKIRGQWIKKAQEIYRNNTELDLHIHMISTITGAKEVYTDTVGKYFHNDEFWIWIPSGSTQAADHLASFLNAFRVTPELMDNEPFVEILEKNIKEYKQLFAHHFLKAPIKINEDVEKGLPMAVLSFNAGTLNSRKASVTPYLPVLSK